MCWLHLPGTREASRLAAQPARGSDCLQPDFLILGPFQHLRGRGSAWDAAERWGRAGGDREALPVLQSSLQKPRFLELEIHRLRCACRRQLGGPACWSPGALELWEGPPLCVISWGCRFVICLLTCKNGIEVFSNSHGLSTALRRDWFQKPFFIEKCEAM